LRRRQRSPGARPHAHGSRARSPSLAPLINRQRLCKSPVLVYGALACLVASHRKRSKTASPCVENGGLVHVGRVAIGPERERSRRGRVDVFLDAVPVRGDQPCELRFVVLGGRSAPGTPRQTQENPGEQEAGYYAKSHVHGKKSVSLVANT